MYFVCVYLVVLTLLYCQSLHFFWYGILDLGQELFDSCFTRTETRTTNITRQVFHFFSLRLNLKTSSRIQYTRNKAFVDHLRSDLSNFELLQECISQIIYQKVKAYTILLLFEGKKTLWVYSFKDRAEVRRKSCQERQFLSVLS